MRVLVSTCMIAVTLCVGLCHDSASAASPEKIKVESISFYGNSAYTERRLSRVMITRTSRFLRAHRYREEIFQDDLKALEQFYHQNGYLEAAITGYDVHVDSTRATADILITVSEGELTQVEGVSVLGNSIYPDSLLLEKITIRAPEALQRRKIDNSTVRLLTFYADNGYLDADIRPDIRINSETHRALVDYYVTEKNQFTIGGIRIQGLDKTREKVVMRELRFSPYEVVNYSRLLESQRKIYMTGLFQSVFVRPQVSANGDSTKKDIIVDVKEGMSGEFNIAGGYGSVERVRGKVEVYNNNLRGTSLKLGLTGKMSFIQRGVELSFTNPWTFNTPIRTDMNLLQEQREEPGYDLVRTGGKLIVGRKYDSSNITLTYLHERTKLSNIKVASIRDDQKLNTQSLKLTYIHDTRDNLFNSTRGMFYETSSEVGWFFTERTSTFYRLTGLFRYFFPLNSLTVAATSVEVGFIDAEGGIGSIPLHERFYAGGPKSLRGFQYEKAGPLDRKRIPIGGKLKIVWNLLEIRRTLYKMVGGVVFTDIGNVWSKPEDVSLGDLRAASGLGLRVNTPIGLGRLDYGFNIDRRKDEPRGQLYFSMGQAF